MVAKNTHPFPPLLISALSKTISLPVLNCPFLAFMKWHLLLQLTEHPFSETAVPADVSGFFIPPEKPNERPLISPGRPLLLDCDTRIILGSCKTPKADSKTIQMVWHRVQPI